MMSLPISLLSHGAVVLLVALVVTRLLRRSSAAIKYAVLASAVAAVFALPAIEAVVPAWHAGTIPGSVAELTEPPALPVAETAGPALASPQTREPARPSTPAVPWRAVAGLVWSLGVAAVLLRTAVGAWRARRIVRRGSPARGASFHAAAAWRELGGRGEVPRIVVSADTAAPIVVGSIAPVVVVPPAASAWSSERWRVVLLHELAHIRRRDGIANFVAQLVCALHWVDPIAWIAARRLREEREHAADDAVLRAGARSSTYAEHLVAIAAAAPHASIAVLAMVGRSRFEARLAVLLDGGRSRGPVGVRRAIGIAAAMGLVAAVAACVSPETAPAHADTTSRGEPTVAKDSAIQAAVDDELDRAVTANHAKGAIAIVLDAKTGKPLAIAARGGADALTARSPGSTLKPLTFAAAFEAGVADPTTRIDCENGVRKYGDKTLEDASRNGVLDPGGILAVSSNIGTAKLVEPLGDRLGEALRRYHIAAPAHIDTRSLEGAAIASGENLRVSPLDLAAAYTAFANAGVYHAPDGTSSERVMSEATAREILAMLDRVVNGDDGTGHAARIPGVRVAGKTGTAVSSDRGVHYASFVGIVPADAPRFVVLVGLDGVTGMGGSVAAPVFARIASRALSR